MLCYPGFAAAFSLSNLYFGCPSEPEMDIKVLGKDPEHLRGADTAALLEKQLAILYLSDEGAEGLGLFKVYSTPASHQSGTGWGLPTVS